MQTGFVAYLYPPRVAEMCSFSQDALSVAVDRTARLELTDRPSLMFGVSLAQCQDETTDDPKCKAGDLLLATLMQI